MLYQSLFSSHRVMPYLSGMVIPALILSAPHMTHAAEKTTESLKNWFAPCAEVTSRDGRILYVAGERSREILVVDIAERRQLGRFPVGGTPTGLSLGPGNSLIVTTSGEENRIVCLDRQSGRVTRAWAARPGVCSPVLAGDRKALYTCNRYEGTVSFFSSTSSPKLSAQPAGHEPISASLSPRGSVLAVANLLPNGAANMPLVQAAVSFLDAQSLKVLRIVSLPNGSTSVRALAFHPVREMCAVVHNVARFQVPTTQVEFGWMHVAALTLLEPGRDRVRATIVLDEARHGAANPSCVAWSPDGCFLCVAHAGTHEISVIDAPALEAKLAALPESTFVSDFTFLDGLRTRIPLPGKGPRALVIDGQIAYVAEFFSDSISVVDLTKRCVLYTIPLGTPGTTDPRRDGERLFNDATLCHQEWQSCSSCHPEGRADGLNWDLLNDGIGNPKNTKGLLLAHKTPPAMSLGGRASAEAAVRSGLRHILFTKVDEAQAAAIDEYLRSLKPVPSPRMVAGRLSRAAVRGKRIFDSPEVGCAVCHPSPLFTDLHSHVVNVQKPDGSVGISFDTPTLVECWRTAPYLHDGSALTVREVLTTKNARDIHDRTSRLSRRQIEDLVAYVLSL